MLTYDDIEEKINFIEENLTILPHVEDHFPSIEQLESYKKSSEVETEDYINYLLLCSIRFNEVKNDVYYINTHREDISSYRKTCSYINKLIGDFCQG